MNPRRLLAPAAALALLAVLPACQTFTPATPRASRAELEQQLAESRDLNRRYERRYGKLLSQRPAHDFRTLRAQLRGKPGTTVVAILGKPARVYTTGTSESWDYSNVAYDPVSGRTVRNLEIWLRNGLVEYMNASF